MLLLNLDALDRFFGSVQSNSLTVCEIIMAQPRYFGSFLDGSRLTVCVSQPAGLGGMPLKDEKDLMEQLRSKWGCNVLSG